jgi:hypothetical protein
VSHALSILVCEPEGTGILGLSYDQWPYTISHEQTKQSEVVSSKNVNQTLKPKPNKPAPDHPWRKGFASPLSQKSRNVPAARGGDISTLDNG